MGRKKMKTNHWRRMGVLAIALSFAGIAHAETDYVTSNLTTGPDFARGITMNGSSEFVLGGSDTGKMVVAGYDLATLNQKWSFISPMTASTTCNSVAADSMN